MTRTLSTHFPHRFLPLTFRPARNTDTSECRLSHTVCRNGAYLFKLRVGETYICDFSERRFNELRDLLLRDPVDPNAPVRATDANQGCAQWCNQWTKKSTGCRGCNH